MKKLSAKILLNIIYSLIVIIIALLILFICKKYLCKVDWEMTHKFVDSLIWPTVVAVIIILNNDFLKKLKDKILNSEETKFKLPGGIEVSLKNTLYDILKNPDGNSEAKIDTLLQIVNKTDKFYLEKLGEQYINSDKSNRMRLIPEIQELNVKLEDLYDIINSPNTGHKISAAIYLQRYLKDNKTENLVFTDEKIKKFIIDGLTDKSSFLRYQILPLVYFDDRLVKEKKETLENIALNDPNDAVSERATLKLVAHSANENLKKRMK